MCKKVFPKTIKLLTINKKHVKMWRSKYERDIIHCAGDGVLVSFALAHLYQRGPLLLTIKQLGHFFFKT